MLPWKLRKGQILPVNQNLPSVYFLPAKFQLVSRNLSLAMIWQMTYTNKLPKLCSATLIQAPRYKGQFALSLGKEGPLIFSYSTRLIRTSR